MNERRNQQQSGRQQRGQSQSRQPQQSQSGGQQRQFDSQGGGQQSGSSGTMSRFADQIREHMEVLDNSGRHVGTIDHIEGDRLKLARSDSKDGQHHYVALNQVAGIEGNKVRLR
jgi:hypothetical protein